MTKSDLFQAIVDSIKEVKSTQSQVALESKIVTDLSFESIDVIDLFFEIQRRTKIEIDLNEMALKVGGHEGRRFNDLTVNDIVEYLNEK